MFINPILSISQEKISMVISEDQLFFQRIPGSFVIKIEVFALE